jgi:phosphoglycerol transferase MdoB-like AlkP superfamily enzyme
MGVCFPNFNYDTSAELFNRGKGIVFSHLGHFLLSAIGSALIVVGAKVIGHLWVGALMASVLFIGLAVLFYFLSNKRLQTMLVKEITF